MDGGGGLVCIGSISMCYKCCQPTLVPISSAALGAWNMLFPAYLGSSLWSYLMPPDEVLFPWALVLLMVGSSTGLPLLLLLPGSWKYSDSLVTCGLEGELSESRWSFFLSFFRPLRDFIFASSATPILGLIVAS